MGYGANGGGWQVNTARTIHGSGTLNFVAKFTPDGAHIGDSQIFDDGVGVQIGADNTIITAIGTAPVAGIKLLIRGEGNSGTSAPIIAQDGDGNAVLAIYDNGVFQTNLFGMAGISCITMMTSIGDWNNNGNATKIVIDDAAKTVAISAVNGIDASSSGTALFSALQTADPLSGAGVWLLGKVITAASALDGAHYLQVKIDGAVKKIALIS